ncbi:unnamed protein product [Tilletia controversa]|nr:unnamed protein product [Tilletia controversa]CAD6940451.1 unnamed protein product [Tilletia controversa]CAD6950936.1 unnamed protein product [Tilletia controversa]CAD6976850.1 unnamed protein product [Tilletia controversa]CAD6979731.1 unnamed protein product [Tilletia controversa]
MASQYIPPPVLDAQPDTPSSSPSPSPSLKQKTDIFDTSDAAFASELTPTPRDKLIRKLKEQPLVPLGSLLTCAALIAASNQLRKGNREQFNRALRWRVGFQGLTVVAAVAGSLYYASAPPPSASSSSENDTPSITTSPGRPATVLQLERAQERQQEERAALRRRLRDAEDLHAEELRLAAAAAEAGMARESASEKDAEDRAQVERYIIGSGKARPVFGQDARR